MVVSASSGNGYTAPIAGRWRRDEDVRYQRVAHDEADIPDSEGSQVEQDKRENHWSSKHLAIHLQSIQKQHKSRIFAVCLSAIIGLLLLYYIVTVTSRHRPESCESWQQGFHCDPKISQFWGQYSPYFAVSTEISGAVPDKCQITFVQVLSRHGARDPTLGKSIIYGATVQKIQTNTKSYAKGFKFIKTYKYTLGADQLTLFGQRQMINSGNKAYHRYKDLTSFGTPFVRASGQNRVIVSAQNWTRGFHKARLRDDPHDTFPYEIVLISEDAGQNNTLDHGLCDAFEGSNLGSEAQQKWADVFTPPIVERLNENMVGADLDGNDVIHVMDLCPYETVASDIGKLSPFCYLFSEKEWQQYDYYQSLGKYYGYSWGNPLGASQGVGFTNELIARLTASPVNDHTSTNHTLDESEETFPLGGRTVFYADFSHDNDMTGIFAALGLYNDTNALSNDTMEDIKDMNGYSASWTVPFAARAYFERMSCPDYSEELVRVLINDRVLPLTTCGGDEYGRCKLSRFLDSLSFAKAGGDWDKCFV